MELFEAENWESRSWYDGPRLKINADLHIAGSGHSGVWHWQQAGDVKPHGGGARVRRRRCCQSPV